jgi:hypothetical protein
VSKANGIQSNSYFRDIAFNATGEVENLA